ncbi:hypothetical protein K474DRAFT_1673586 [Panus rudis PR-1116 ss-1]|nr:hypothetical protein K474DRAFT_1673586 [Panus rudis PR-1116 ss-1]
MTLEARANAAQSSFSLSRRVQEIKMSLLTVLFPSTLSLTNLQWACKSAKSLDASTDIDTRTGNGEPFASLGCGERMPIKTLIKTLTTTMLGSSFCGISKASSRPGPSPNYIVTDFSDEVPTNGKRASPYFKGYLRTVHILLSFPVDPPVREETQWEQEQSFLRQ